MEDDELRNELISLIKNRQDLAKEIGIDYVNFTKILNGASFGKRTKSKCQEYLECNRTTSNLP